MRTSRCLSLLLLASLSLACIAQTNPNLETGIKPYGSYDGGSFDSVSLTNGNLSLNIPIFDYPQRGGLKATVRLIYNNKGWSVLPDCWSDGTCTPVWHWAGQSVALQVDDGAVSVTGELYKQAPIRT